jgi:hypothetical protein
MECLQMLTMKRGESNYTFFTITFNHMNDMHVVFFYWKGLV